jgi:hypothetical protein
MDAGDMREKLRGYLNELDWSHGATKDDIMENVTERDNDLREMVDEYIAEGTYPSVDEVLFLIPDQAWQSSQGDQWRGPEIQYVEDVETTFDESPISQSSGPSAGPTMGKASPHATKASSAAGSGRAGGGNAPRGGMPGDGAGRTYDPRSRHAGVWPVSGPPPDDPNATMQGMASFGQGDRGAAGYQDSGRSEAQTVPPKGGEPGKSGEQHSQRHLRQGGQHVGAPGANAGEVDPMVSGSGETTGTPPVFAGGAGFGNAAGGGEQGDAADTADRTRQSRP